MWRGEVLPEGKVKVTALVTLFVHATIIFAYGTKVTDDDGKATLTN